MKLSVCHYSYHRTWAEKKWDCLDLAENVKALGIEGVDFHAGLLGSIDDAPQRIKSALDATGLELSGLSLSNNFNKDTAEEVNSEIETVLKWMRLAAEVKAPVSRIFGGHITDRSDKDILAEGFGKILDALGKVTEEAEKLGITLALENHGGLPCTAEEQLDVINKINSPNLRATIDIGNYMTCGQEAHAGTTIAAPYAKYIHVKDFKKTQDSKKPWGWGIEACTIGQGDVDQSACLKVLKDAGYAGYLALEYEGVDDEITAVPQSISFIKDVLRKLA